MLQVAVQMVTTGLRRIYLTPCSDREKGRKKYGNVITEQENKGVMKEKQSRK